MANASTTTLRLYSDSVISIPTGSNVHGATNQQQGYRMGLYEILCGWSSSFPRKNRIAILKFPNCLNPLATVLIS